MKSLAMLSCMYVPAPLSDLRISVPLPASPYLLVSGSFSLSPVQRRNRGTADSKPALTRRQPQMLPSLVPTPPLISVSVAPTSNPIRLLSLVSDNWQFEDYFRFTSNLALTKISCAYTLLLSPRNPLKSADVRIIYEFYIYEFLCFASSRCFKRHRVTSGWILLDSHFRRRKIYMTFHSKSCIRSIRVCEKHRKRERLTRIVSRRSENIVKLFPLSFLSYTYRLS